MSSLRWNFRIFSSNGRLSVSPDVLLIGVLIEDFVAHSEACISRVGLEFLSLSKLCRWSMCSCYWWESCRSLRSNPQSNPS